MKNPLKFLTDIKGIEKNVEGRSERIIHSKQKALERSINSGSASSVSASIAVTYLTPFALLLKATSFQIGLMSSFSSLVSPFAELFGSNLMFSRSRKKIVTRFIFLQALVWIPIIALAFLFWKGLFVVYLPITFIILVTLFVALGSIALPAWFSWMGDLIPPQNRGRYLSIRDRVIELISLATTLIAAILLDAFKTRGLAVIGFAILFSVAFTFRMIAFGILKTQFAPKMRLKKKSYLPFTTFIKRLDNIGKFAIYQGLFFFALMVASPFFTVYMLEALNFSYKTFTFVTLSTSVFYLIFAPLAGKFSDKYGNKKLFYVGNIFFALSPILWMLSQNVIYLVFVPQLVSGIANAAFLIAAVNFTYDVAPKQQLATIKAYSSLLIGAGAFIGPLIGGYIIDYVNFSSVNPFFVVFVLSSVLRILVGIFFLSHIKESRKVKKLPKFKFTLSHPYETIQSEITWLRKVFK